MEPDFAERGLSKFFPPLDNVQRGRVFKRVEKKKSRRDRQKFTKRFSIWNDLVDRNLGCDKSSERLCPQCQHLDFNVLFQGPRYPATERVEPIEIGPITDILSSRRSKCAFCRLLARAVESYGATATLSGEVDCFVTPWRADRMEEGWIVSQGEDNIATQLMVELKKNGEVLRRNGSAPNIATIHQSNEYPRHFFSSARLPSRIDFCMVKNWLQHCEIHHGICESSSHQPSSYLNGDLVVIDVERYTSEDSVRMLQRVDHSTTRYVALSYVWNQGAPGPLRSRFRKQQQQINSATIADAVEVCKRLGEKYLWVDALCIRGEPEERQMQIANMDSIYSHAVLTIIAAQRRNSAAGLPGTRTDRRQDDQTEMIRGTTLTLSRPPLSALLAESKWKLRGWTFQEGVLSRRCLIFTDEEVLFHCHQSLSRESLYEIPHDAQLSAIGTFEHSSDNITSRDLGSSWNYLTFARLLDEYTKRQFTMQTDVLFAFRGLENLLSRRFGVQFISGLPVSNLVTSLCWFGSTGLVRRSGFPSWSWAGWQGNVHQDFHLLQTPLESNKFATLATIEAIRGGSYLRVLSSVANIALGCRNGENGTHCFARGSTPLLKNFLPRPPSRSFFLLSLPQHFHVQRHIKDHGTGEFLLLARLRDSDFFKLTKLESSRAESEYVIALLIDRKGSTAQRIGLLAIPATIWDQSSPREETVMLK